MQLYKQLGKLKKDLTNKTKGGIILATNEPTEIIKMPTFTIVWNATNHFETDVEAEDVDSAYKKFTDDYLGKIDCEPLETSIELEHILLVNEEEEEVPIEEEG